MTGTRIVPRRRGGSKFRATNSGSPSRGKPAHFKLYSRERDRDRKDPRRACDTSEAGEDRSVSSPCSVTDARGRRHEAGVPLVVNPT